MCHILAQLNDLGKLYYSNKSAGFAMSIGGGLEGNGRKWLRDNGGAILQKKYADLACVGVESIGHVHRWVISISLVSSTAEWLLFEQFVKLLLRSCVGVFVGRHHDICKQHHVIIWERGWRWGVPVIPLGPSQKELHITGFRIEPKAKYMYGTVYVPSSWLGMEG